MVQLQSLLCVTATWGLRVSSTSISSPHGRGGSSRRSRGRRCAGAWCAEQGAHRRRARGLGGRADIGLTGGGRRGDAREVQGRGWRDRPRRGAGAGLACQVVRPACMVRPWGAQPTMARVARTEMARACGRRERRLGDGGGAASPAGGAATRPRPGERCGVGLRRAALLRGSGGLGGATAARVEQEERRRFARRGRKLRCGQLGRGR